MPANVYRRCRPMPNMFKKLCEMFLSLLWLQRGQISNEEVTPQDWEAQCQALVPRVLQGCLCGTEKSSGVASSLKWRFPDLFLQGLGVLKSHPQRLLHLNPILCSLIYNTLCWGWVQLSVFIPRSLGSFLSKDKATKILRYAKYRPLYCKWNI